MVDDFPEYLRLHVEDGSRDPVSRDFPHLEQLCESFESVTGWCLRYISGIGPNAAEMIAAGMADPAWSTEVCCGYGQPAGHLVMEQPLARRRTGKREQIGPTEIEAQQLAAAVAGLLGELGSARQAIWHREADLAAGIPVTPRPDEDSHLARRLEAILRCGAQAVGCQQAAAYLLDDATSELKLRSCWGLDKQALLEPARPLRGAMSDLEALVGNAVVLDDPAMLDYWCCPRDCAMAVCVPISTPSTPLGTLWLFGNKPSQVSDEKLQLVEVVAGRLAAELEREVLINHAVTTRQQSQHIDRAARLQYHRLPQIAPLLDGWGVAGWCDQSDQVCGDFYDWTVLADGRLGVAVASAAGSPIESAITATVVQSAIRAHGVHPHEAPQLLQWTHDTLWTSSPGDQLAEAVYLVLDPETGQFQYGLAGDMHAVQITGRKHDVLSRPSPLLGSDPDAVFARGKGVVGPNDVLVLYNAAFRRHCLQKDADWTEQKLVQSLQKLNRKKTSAEALLEASCQQSSGTRPESQESSIGFLSSQAGFQESPQRDTLVIIRRHKSANVG